MPPIEDHELSLEADQRSNAEIAILKVRR